MEHLNSRRFSRVEVNPTVEGLGFGVLSLDKDEGIPALIIPSPCSSFWTSPKAPCTYIAIIYLGLIGAP